MTQQAIDQLRSELSEDFGNMLHNEVTSVLNNVFLELKELSKFRQNSVRTRKVANAAQAAQSLGGNLTPFDGIRKNLISADSRSVTSSVESGDNVYPSALPEI